jgi:hypothetical protein
MDRDKEQVGDFEHEAVPAGHHFAAPEVEEWKPHPYEEVGVGRKESLKAELPEQRTQDTDKKE